MTDEMAACELTRWHQCDWLAHKKEQWHLSLGPGTHPQCRPQCHRGSYSNPSRSITSLKYTAHA